MGQRKDSYNYGGDTPMTPSSSSKSQSSRSQASISSSHSSVPSPLTKRSPLPKRSGNVNVQSPLRGPPLPKRRKLNPPQDAIHNAQRHQSHVSINLDGPIRRTVENDGYYVSDDADDDKSKVEKE
eukprot:345649_1